MSLLDEIRGSVRHAGVLCRVQAVLSELDDSDRADLDAAFRDQTIPATAIVTALKARGHVITYQTVNRHRRNLRGEAGGCTCPA